ncbi:MAG: Gfo/Idh/MocA family oxidoreductase [bacterium]|nr:Gfo/Idh/MocA family oxidoreductase [bacterium]
MKKLRVGVIGSGGIGRHHIMSYRTHPGAEVVAISDTDPGRLEAVGNEFNVPSRYATAQAMLEKESLDVVSVCTPNKYHKELTIAAFEAGCHVLCEKPMAMNTTEARAMLAASKKAGKRLMINFSYRFYEQSMALKRQVETGILGDIYFARTVWHRRRGVPLHGGWFSQKAIAGGGPLIDLGVHRLDLALWLMDYPRPVWVMGSTYNPIATRLAAESGRPYDVEDLAVGLIKFANGATVEVEASWAANIKERELMETRLLGTKGGLVQRNRNETYDFEAEIYFEQGGTQFDMQPHPPSPPMPKAMYHFVDCIINRKPHIATGEEGLTVMELLDALYLSARKGEPVKIKR